MEFSGNPEVHPRLGHGSRIVYPVFARRSGGLSVGINLFPDAKRCNFDCPYCEVQPSAGSKPFSISALNSDLHDFMARYALSEAVDSPIKDFCISGDGEPTTSPYLEETLSLLAEVRLRCPAIAGTAGRQSDAPESPDIVLITNSTGFLRSEVAEMLHRFFLPGHGSIWAKLDSASPSRFALMSGSWLSFSAVVSGIIEFSTRTPLVLQTMLCALPGESPEILAEDPRGYADLLLDMMRKGSRFKEIHLYTLARAPQVLSVRPLADQTVEAFGASVRERLSGAVRVRTFGQRGELSQVSA